MGKRTSFLAPAGDYFPNNVVYLEKFLRTRWLLQRVKLLYIGDESVSESNLQTLANSVREVRLASGEEDLFRTLANYHPDIVLIESGLKWVCPVSLTDTLSHMTGLPVVMVCTRNTRKADRPELLKRAFAAGLQDILSTPMRKEDIEETFGVILKYRSFSGAKQR